MKKSLFLALGLMAAAANVAADPVSDRYNRACMACHAGGAAGAPRTGNAEDWAPRLEKGMDALIASTKQGLNAMPPRGLCGDCSDDDYRALIQFMSGAK